MIKIENDNLNIFEYIENVYCLDNFSAFSLRIKGNEYKTAEHAFQSIKFEKTSPLIAEKIRNANSPFEAREIAQLNKQVRREDWSKVKYEIMEEILFEKTKQNPYVKKKLLSTGNEQIIEDCGTDDDKDWGCGIDGMGENNLGKIWMKVRSRIRN